MDRGPHADACRKRKKTKKNIVRGTAGLGYEKLLGSTKEIVCNGSLGCRRIPVAGGGGGQLSGKRNAEGDWTGRKTSVKAETLRTGRVREKNDLRAVRGSGGGAETKCRTRTGRPSWDARKGHGLRNVGPPDKKGRTRYDPPKGVCEPVRTPARVSTHTKEKEERPVTHPAGERLSQLRKHPKKNYFRIQTGSEKEAEPRSSGEGGTGGGPVATKKEKSSDPKGAERFHQQSS